MSKPTLTIVRKKISDLHADPANANRHPENNLRAIADSLHAFGQVEPLVVQKGTGKVIGGNGRLEVLRNSGAQEVDVVELDIDGTQATALAIALNRTAKTSEFDDETLASLLQSLPQECQIAAGFDPDELNELLSKLTPEVVEDVTPEPPASPVSRLGDLWVCGEHRVLCGDSTKAEDVGRLMDGEKVGMCFTSPPYNADTSAGDGDIFNKKKSKKLYGEQYGDNLDSSTYVSFARSALTLCFEHTRGFIFWNVSYNANARNEYIEQIIPWLPHLIEQVCWKKHSAIPVKGSMRRAWEPVYIFSTEKESLRLQEVESNFWDISNTGCQADGHKACFPIALPEKGMLLVPQAKSIYDPFLGSGTTLIAAEQLGRKCYGMEISPQYVDVIVTRWEKLTGKQATLEATGKTFAQTAAERGIGD